MPQRLAFPLAVTPAGRLASVPVDSAADIAQSVALLVSTRPGERRSAPTYGIPDPLFGGADVDAIADAIAEWEDRADPVLIDRIVDGDLEALALYGSAPVPSPAVDQPITDDGES